MKIHSHLIQYTKKIILISCFAFIIFYTLTTPAQAIPDYGEDVYSCHSKGGYSIESNATDPIEVTMDGSFSVEIIGTGQEVILQVYPEGSDNELFSYSPKTMIADSSEHDLEPEQNKVKAIITFTAPDTAGQYKLMILAREPTDARPDLAILYLTVNVGEFEFTWYEKIAIFFTTYIFSHLNIYLGGIAVGLLMVATILYELNPQKYTKTHGILASSSFLLTTVNIILIIPLSITTLNIYSSDPAYIDYGHVIHMILGSIGYIAAIIALLLGLSGFRNKRPGRIALICWTFNFIYGISPLGWVNPL